MNLLDKLTILSDAAKYDAACTSSGARRGYQEGKIGCTSTSVAGCCHTFSSDGRCVTLLKVLLSNDCCYNCKYCVNRCTNDTPRATFTPEELAELTIEFYRRNYIEGLFLSSAVLRSPDYTMEQMIGVLELLRGRGFAASPLKGRTGTPEENRRRDTDRLAEVKRQQEALRKQLDELAERLPELYLCADRLASRLQREENRRRLLTDGCIVAFDGWVPEKKTARLTAYLDTADCDYTLSDPTTEQIPEVPVLLEDNAVARSMNCITEQYSLPAYDGVDPNPVMAPFFILFFGMMMADIGYGLLMLLGSWLFLKKKRPDDRSFMEMIFWCGVTTVVFGAMTGSFFGDFLPQLFKFFDPESTFALPALFSPLDDTMAIMVGSLILGALQVFTGMTVSVVEKCKKGCFMDALFDEITWWIILAGTGLAVLGIGSVSGVPVVLIAGVLMLVYGAGRGKKGFGKVTGFVAAVYNGVTGFFSDILSYVRLMALMLSGAVLAQVFNMLGATTGNVVTFIIIAFVGNMLNLALNLLGCYVHDMRLQFLEFFGRFYKDGGKAYRPLRVRAKHVEIIKEDTKSC